MKILNCVGQSMYSINHSLKNKIVFCADHVVNDEVLKQSAVAVELVGVLLEKNNIKIDELRPTNLFFSKDGSINLHMDENTLGNVISLISINATKTANYEPVKILTIIVEELCHYFFNIHDEKEVKYKVIEVLNIKYPLLEIEDIFDMNTV